MFGERKVLLDIGNGHFRMIERIKRFMPSVSCRDHIYYKNSILTALPFLFAETI
jgi:hypothetical protein